MGMRKRTDIPDRWGKGTGRDADGGFNVLLDSLKQRLCEGATGDAVRKPGWWHMVKVCNARKREVLL